MNSDPTPEPQAAKAGSGVASRRSVLSAVVGLSVGSLSGCMLLQDEIERSASPAELDDETRTEVGFEHQGTEETTVTQTVTVAGEERDLSLTNYIAAYRRIVPESDEAVASFQSFSTPSVTIGDAEANPVWELEPARLIRRFASEAQMNDMQDIREVGSPTFRALGEVRQFTMLEGTAQRQGQEVTVRLPVGKFKHDDDILILIAGYPEQFGGRAQAQRAFEGVVHPA